MGVGREAWDTVAATSAAQVDGVIDELLDDETRAAAGRGDDGAVVDALRLVVESGGRRLRPALCRWGYLAAGGKQPNDRIVVHAGVAIELLHTFAIIHDDVMDDGATRRGAPCLHRCQAELHRRRGWRGEPRRFGEAMAVLAGDLAFALASRFAGELPSAGRRVWAEMCAELVSGQHMDLRGAASGGWDGQQAVRVALFKSARYTLVRPLQLGAALAAPSPDRLADLNRLWLAYGDAVGQAFQLQDDLQGTFGDPAVTGKPVGDDLRQGKPTLLLALAWANASSFQRRLLERSGDATLTDDEVAVLRDTVAATGAAQGVLDAIAQHGERAQAALSAADLHPVVSAALAYFCRVAGSCDGGQLPAGGHTRAASGPR